ncbi:hypothetical protein Afil01_29140 [Actinorhabdospora filicis]|uniref:VWFA domain-containing protein n=1 Tax=Actinorhabdospora filicis TaxID=1785913 RepID=A0A9W6SLR0_9ACTN|nr:hypothetical protein [Actinorhabdospora filicis]GLZ78107.1 hypothetical protein Afil01_29140 [Actinorhabdospora filicis]
MPDVRGILLPAYVVADESGSMSACYQELTDGLTSLFETLRGEPMIAAKLRLAVLGFSDDVEVRLPLSDVRYEERPPTLSIRGATSYAAAFSDLLGRIPVDVAMLKADGYKVHRPVVFFLSDGQPTDRRDRDWQDPRSRLVDRDHTPAAPNIVAIGAGGADAQTILAVATRPEFGFVAVPGADLGRAISEFFQMLTASLVATGQAMASGNPEIVVRKPDPEHFRLAIDVV